MSLDLVLALLVVDGLVGLVGLDLVLALVVVDDDGLLGLVGLDLVLVVLDLVLALLVFDALLDVLGHGKLVDGRSLHRIGGAPIDVVALLHVHRFVHVLVLVSAPTG